MTEIKPCPWCGGMSISTHEGSTFRWMVARCDQCGAQAPEIRVDTMSKDRAEAIDKATSEAIAEWNNRYEGDSHD